MNGRTDSGQGMSEDRAMRYGYYCRGDPDGACPAASWDGNFSAGRVSLLDLGTMVLAVRAIERRMPEL